MISSCIIFLLSLTSVVNMRVNPDIPKQVLEMVKNIQEDMQFIKRDSKKIDEKFRAYQRMERGISEMAFKCDRANYLENVQSGSVNQHKISSSNQHLCTNSKSKKKSKYRSYDGSCNNILNNYGVMDTVQPRLIPAMYDDYMSSPKTRAKLGDTLPSARRVSKIIHSETPLTTNDFSLMLMQWGQFLDHDLSITPMHEEHKCDICSDYNSAVCFPIQLNQDTFFQGDNAPKCMPFKRSKGRIVAGIKEQLNEHSSFIDASMVYGADESTHEKLKDPINRHLMSSSAEDASTADMLPLDSNIPGCRAADGKCFLSGDDRVNVTPGNTMLHAVFHRLHNIIAKKLAKALKSLTKDELFEEARRLVIAIMQHITFNEYLPRVLGLETMKKYSLQLHQHGYYDDYSSSCNAAIFNEFSTAAFRFGHSQIKPVMYLLSNNEMVSHDRFGSPARKFHLRDHFHNPDMIKKDNGNIEDLIRGLVSQPMDDTHKSFSREITNHLFEEKSKNFSGLDLAALNIQRGRDHGLPGYNEYRDVCGLESLIFFNQTTADINPHVLSSLSTVYQHPDDVDLFTGIMSETQMAGSMVGPTLGCLISLQFKKLRQCDRFWYETSDQELKFSSAQLSAIREVSLSSVLCLTGHGITKMTESAMDIQDELTNPMTDCRQLEDRINLKPWTKTKNKNDDQNLELPTFPWNIYYF